MSKVVVRSFAVSLDGFGAGTQQSLKHPLGVRGPELMEWFFPTVTFRKMNGMPGGETGIDDQIAAAGMEGIGAYILGRNMFGPVRGPWPDESWKGWWGEEPPYHVPTFVLTHHPRAPIPMKGGTEFRFVTDGLESALRQARQVAGAKDIRIGGGVSTIRQFLAAKLIDELHLAVRPIFLGEGENLFQGLDLRALGYQTVESKPGERAMHVIVRRSGSDG
jgi:dihydrofolate reductase